MFIEKEMLFNLDHQGIVKFIDAFQTNDKYYFVMEYLSGGDLAEMIHLNSSR